MSEIRQYVLDIDGLEETVLTDRQTDRQAPLSQKIATSQKILKLAADMSKTYYNAPLIIAYSGGKDSDVLVRLAESCLKPDEYELFNSHTTVDAPETVYHIRNVFKEFKAKGVKTTIDYHVRPEGKRETMWSLIEKKSMPPTRVVRYCCQVLKESGTPNRLTALGVREAESTKRQGRNIFGIRASTYAQARYYSLDHTEEVHKEAQEIQDKVWDCMLIANMRKHKSSIVNAIYFWQDTDIWDYIKQSNIVTNPLYKKGYKRIGCIGCPMASYAEKMKEFSDYPTYKKAYIKAFDKMLNRNKEKGIKQKANWKTGEDVFRWWIGEKNVEGQISMFDEE